uniref:F-box domain-containing protein n=1 Tax=Mycena chlorophos TaxID=658473 RepID=A0ABQ0M5Q8_MYCCL|nr:predicted protein [Mycena chlorophos]
MEAKRKNAFCGNESLALFPLPAVRGRPMTSSFSRCLEANPDISGLGVRLSFYLQTLALVLLAGRSLEEALSSVWTLLGTSFGLAISALVTASQGQLPLYQAIIVTDLIWLANFAIFMALAAYNRHPRGSHVVQYCTIVQTYVSLGCVLFLWDRAGRLDGNGSAGTNNSTAISEGNTVFVVLFVDTKAENAGRTVALVMTSLLLAAYSLVAALFLWKRMTTKIPLLRRTTTNASVSTPPTSFALAPLQPTLAPPPSSARSASSTTSGVLSSSSRHRSRHRHGHRHSSGTSHGAAAPPSLPLDPHLSVLTLLFLPPYIITVACTELQLVRNDFCSSSNSSGNGNSNNAWGFGQILALTVTIVPVVITGQAFREYGLKQRPRTRDRSGSHGHGTRRQVDGRAKVQDWPAVVCISGQQPNRITNYRPVSPAMDVPKGAGASEDELKTRVNADTAAPASRRYLNQQNSRTTIPITTLPNDILIEIFDLLPAPPLEIMGVCKRWREACVDAFRLWRVKEETWDQEYLEFLVALRVSRGAVNLLHTLDVDSVADYEQGQSELIASLAPTLRMLKLDVISEELMAELREVFIASEMPHLRSLSLGFDTWGARSATPLAIVFANMPSLETLSLNGLDWAPEPTSSILALTHLDLCESRMTVSTLCDLLRRLRGLRGLILRSAIDTDAALSNWSPGSNSAHLNALETLVLIEETTVIQSILCGMSFPDTTKIIVEYRDAVTLADMDAVIEQACRFAASPASADAHTLLFDNLNDVRNQPSYKIELYPGTPSDFDSDTPAFSCAFVAQRESEGPIAHALVAALAHSQVSNLCLLYTEGLPESLWEDLHARVASSLTTITFSFGHRNTVSLLLPLISALSTSDSMGALHTIKLDLAPRGINSIWRDVQKRFLPLVFQFLEALSMTGQVLPRMQVRLWNKDEKNWDSFVASIHAQNLKLDELVNEVETTVVPAKPRKLIAAKR